MSEHFVKICKQCGTAMDQCRCSGCHKEVIYDVCERCRPVEEAPATVSSVQLPQPQADLKAQVYDLGMRRTAALQTDPALRLAEKLVAVITANTDTLDAVDHLVALELAGRAIIETIKHARGETWLNACFVDAARRVQAYEISWPDNDQSKSIYDEKKPEPPPTNIVAFPSPKPEKT